jgi:GntR family transcriptional regulator
MLPPENDLCNMLQVSRPKVKDQFLSKLVSFNQEMLDKGKIPKTVVLALERLPGTPEFNEKLNLPFDAPLIHLSRLQSADDVNTVYLDTYLSYDRFPGLLDINFTVQSLYQVLEETYHVCVIRAQREIEAVNARKNEAALLNIAPNKALCLVRTLSYEAGSAQPVEYSVARYRGDMTKFTVEIYC